MPDCPASGQSCPASGQSGTAVKKTGKSHRTRLHTLKQLRFNTFISFPSPRTKSSPPGTGVKRYEAGKNVRKESNERQLFGNKNKTSGREKYTKRIQMNDNYIETKTKHRAHNQ
jgi:hypothetical protein